MGKKIKGQIWVSAVLYMLIASIVIVLILQAGMPIIQKSKEKTVYTKTRDQFLSVDNVIKDVIAEGVGSQRVVSLDIPEGRVSLRDNTLKWELESETRILEPGTQIDLGNVKVFTDIDVSAYDYGNHFMMENTHIRANFSKIGTPQSYGSIDTSKIIESFYSVDTLTELATTGNFTFVLDNDPSTSTGTGYTELIPSGNNSNINFAKVLVHMFDAGIDNHNFTLSFMLESKGDYLKIDVINFQ